MAGLSNGMEPEEISEKKTEESLPNVKKDHFLGTCIVIAALIIGGALVFMSGFKVNTGVATAKTVAKLEKIVLPDKGVALPISWGDFGKQLVDNGAIDLNKFEALYAQRGGLDEQTRKLLTENNNGPLVITKENANVVLNLLWALGLANKNEILEKGEIVDSLPPRAGRWPQAIQWITTAITQ